MISKEVADDGLAALSVTAATLIEDAVEGLVTTATDVRASLALATNLAALGAELSALGAAAAVLARHRDDG